ncbi:hypothetical protein ACIHCQ_09665 [Streptomyces sp. NPDC052236]|uniref:hypothetical protein n=1 Tax=Streptomyces sp. NPDC052236 TaxID=3365686 RepID=UPI0037D67555
MADMEFEKSPQTYGSHQAPAHYEPGEGCLATVIRIPVRIVVLLVVVPVRMVWDLLVVCARGVHRGLLRPLGRGLAWVYETVLTPIGRGLVWAAVFLGKALFVWPWVALWRYGVVVPVVWIYRQLLTPLGHGLAWIYRRLLVPVGRGIAAALVWLGMALFVWPWVALWRYVVVPVVTYGLVVPLVWIYRQLLTPLGHGLAWLIENLLVVPVSWIWRRLLVPAGRGIGAALVWLAMALFVWLWVGLWRYLVVPVVTYGLVVPVVWIYRQLLTPLGHALVWLVVTLLVTPVVWVYQHVLAPIGRELLAAVGVAWRIAGYISRAVGRALKWLAWNLVGRPVRWCYQNICAPVGHFVRDAVWRPARTAAVEAGRAALGALRTARETVRQTRRDAWRALVGGPPAPPAPSPGEPVVRQARTLGSTTVSGAAAEPEISLHKRG